MRNPSPIRALSRNRRTGPLVWGIVCGTLVGILSWGASWLPGVLLETSTGFAAKVAASAVFVSGRSVESVYQQELEADGFPQQVFRFFLAIQVDPVAKTLTASALGVKRTAVFREGYGCTLLVDRTADQLRAAISEVDNSQTHSRPSSRSWQALAEAGDSKFDRQILEKAIAAVFENQKLKTRAVVVIRDGRLIAERYADGFHADMPLPGWSMTKSVTDALIGIRVRQGKMNPNAPMNLQGWQAAGDPRAAITLNQMLQMSSGLQWNEESPDYLNDMTRMLFRESNMAGFAARASVVEAPGKDWVYSSGTTNLICQALRNSFEEDREYWEFPRRELFDPLGMSSAVFELDESGTFVGSSYCFATARDWGRFGQLYLDDGIVDGRRILPEGWVATASKGTEISKGRYGRHFWLPRDKTLPAGTFYCRGFEGQLIAIVPEKQTVIVRLGSTRDRKAWDPDAFTGSILKALR